MADNEITEVAVKGRSKERATSLLAAAAKLGYDKSVVRTQLTGYKVPSDVAELGESLLSDLPGQTKAEPEPKAKPAKKTTARKPAKKTAAKTTAAKKTASKTAASTKE